MKYLPTVSQRRALRLSKATASRITTDWGPSLPYGLKLPPGEANHPVPPGEGGSEADISHSPPVLLIPVASSSSPPAPPGEESSELDTADGHKLKASARAKPRSPKANVPSRTLCHGLLPFFCNKSLERLLRLFVPRQSGLPERVHRRESPDSNHGTENAPWHSSPPPLEPDALPCSERFEE